MFGEGKPNSTIKRDTEKYNNIDFSNLNYHPEIKDRREEIFNILQKTSNSEDLDKFCEEGNKG